MIKRIIDKQTNLFLRDDFSHDEETELALDVTPAQGLFRPRWDGTGWVEDMTPEEIESLKTQAEPQEPTVEERIQALEAMELERILGGMF